MARYASAVLSRVCAEEAREADAEQRSVLRRARKLLIREESLLTAEARSRLESVLHKSQSLQTVYQYKVRLQEIWRDRAASQERLREALQEWCREAEASGIRALQEFARTLPQYTMTRSV